MIRNCSAQGKVRTPRVRADFATQVQASFDGERILNFLQQLARTLRVPLVLIWDRLQAHRGQPVAGWLARQRHRVQAHLLPAYAPN